MRTPVRLGMTMDEAGRINVTFLADDGPGRARVALLFARVQPEIENFEIAAQARLAATTTSPPIATGLVHRPPRLKLASRRPGGGGRPGATGRCDGAGGPDPSEELDRPST
jgi:hypothetical protein